MPKVHVIYRNTRVGQSALLYACDSARLFSDEPLVVLCARDPRAEPVLGEFFKVADAALKDNVRHAVSELIRDPNVPFNVDTYDEPCGPSIPPGAILVDPEAQEDADFHCIHPADETSVERNHPGTVLITFSDGETGLTAANAAFELIGRLRDNREHPSAGPDVIFYHTTWRHPNALSPDPIDHMCDSAVRMMLSLEQAARDHNLSYKTVIETHRDVAVGVLEAVNREGVVLIAMDRSEQVSDGSYVDQILAQSAVPVFVASPGTKPIRAAADDDAVAAHKNQRRMAIAAGRSTKRPGWIARLLNAPILANPLFVMGLVAAMYVYKGASKVAVGWWVGLPTLLPDGLHNAIADLPEALIVMVAIIIARRPCNQNYQLGRMNIESFASAAIGVLLYITAFVFMLECVLGLLSYWSAGDHLLRSYLPFLPAVDHTTLTTVEFTWVMGVSLSSMVLSLLVSRYQIVIGNRTGHGSMVADGKETATDGWIEFVTIVGVVAEFSTGYRVFEFVIGPVVAVLIYRTAQELFVTNWRVLLQHSIGKEIENALRAAVMKVAGVIRVTDLITFQVGHKAEVLMTIESYSRSAALPFVKRAVEGGVIAGVLDSGDFKAVEEHVKIDRPESVNSRIGFPLCMLDADTGYVAPSLASATHVAVCDVIFPQVVRTKVIPLAGLDIPDWLLEKRFDALAVLDPDDGSTRALLDESKSRAAGALEADILPDTVVVRATTYTLSPLGVKIRRKRARPAAQVAAV